MNLKVLQLISGGDTGGAKTHIFSLMEGLSGLIDTKIICFIEDTFYQDAIKKGINIEVIPQKRRSDMSVVNKIADIVNNEDYDIIHCHGARANSIALFLKSKVNVPMITTIHSDYLLDFKDSFYKNLIFTPINTFSLKKFDYYVAVTENFKEMLVSRGFDDKKVFTLYNGINTDINEDIIPKEEFLRKNNIHIENQFIIGQVARLDKVKNIQMTIKAIKELVKKNKNVLFLIAGEGEELSELQNLANELGVTEYVKFLGYVKENMSFFNAIDLNILTSVSESFPYVILEAAKMKKPTIATSVGGIQELIRYGTDGYLVKKDDYNDLADKINFLANNKELLEKMGIAVNKRVIENFSTTAMANRQLEIYNEVLRRKRNDW